MADATLLPEGHKLPPLLKTKYCCRGAEPCDPHVSERSAYIQECYDHPLRQFSVGVLEQIVSYLLLLVSVPSTGYIPIFKKLKGAAGGTM